jgi:cation transport protein ChaC
MASIERGRARRVVEPKAPTVRSLDDDATRKRLIEGTLLGALRADPPPGVQIRTDAQLEESLSATLRAHDRTQDVHVFGYGSLMWNPAIDAAHACVARVQGWHRRFCLRMLLGRGTPQAPGVMLALDRGGGCHGMLYRISAAKVETELRLLWRREMLAGSYDARWVFAQADGRKVRTLTFVANRQCGRYIGDRPLEDVAHLVRTGAGSLGTSRAYFDSTLQALHALGIRDAGIERLRRAIVRADEEAGIARSAREQA